MQYLKLHNFWTVLNLKIQDINICVYHSDLKAVLPKLKNSTMKYLKMSEIGHNSKSYFRKEE